MVTTDDPSGTVAVRTAGVVEFRATLDYEGDPPDRRILPDLPDAVRSTLEETVVPGRREISGEIRALTAWDLGAALRATLRAVTAAAALDDALLEMSAIRRAVPLAAPAAAVQALALDLWREGFPVSFAHSWTVAPEGAVAVGCREDALREFLLAHESWEPA